ncbi:MAG: hypothetical protein DMG27_22285 [Acidobacteria bacterium]|nr:MAG: hypothetical protein DMG27_22285 [Acidobacteriota bacterium]
MRASPEARKKRAKKAALRELERLSEDRLPRNQTLLARFARCNKPRSPSREPSTPNGAPTAQRRLPHRPDGCRR